MKRHLAGRIFWVLVCLGLGVNAGQAAEHSPCRLVFDPQIRALLREAISSSRSSIDAEVFELTDEDVLKDLERAAGRGVSVRLILCPTQTVNRKSVARLQGTGVQIRWYPVQGKNQLMHMKAGCFDCQTVILGSANWTHWGLTLHHEGVAVMQTMETARIFCRQFQLDWDKSTDLSV